MIFLFICLFQSKESSILATPSMSVFINPKTMRVWQENDTMTRPKLANTLRVLAGHPLGGNALYNRTSYLSHWLAEDLQQQGGIMTVEDLENYKYTYIFYIYVFYIEKTSRKIIFIQP